MARTPLASIPLGAIVCEDILHWCDDLAKKVKPASVNRELAVLKAAFRVFFHKIWSIFSDFKRILRVLSFPQQRLTCRRCAIRVCILTWKLQRNCGMAPVRTAENRPEWDEARN